MTHFSDPSCPWAYSAIPFHTVLRWRYGAQLRWRLVVIGLSEDARRYVDSGYTPAGMAQANASFRRFGMPLLAQPRARIVASSRACRAIVATRLAAPGREHEALRALALAWFTTTAELDRDDELVQALGRVQGLDAAAVVAAIEDPEVLDAYAQDKELTRHAEGGPTHFQGKARRTDGPVRYSAPSVVFESAGTRLEAGGFQPLEAYDVLVANLDTGLVRRGPAADPLEALAEFPGGLATQEVAAIMAPNLIAPDRDAAERALVELAAEGRVTREALADDALWRAA